MALRLRKEFADGFVATYHRVNDIKMRVDGGPCSFTLESHESEQDRAIPGARCKTERFDFIPSGVGDPFSQAYAALRLNPEWQDAESDSDAPVNAPAAAVAESSAKWDEAAHEWVPLVVPPTLDELRAAGLERVDYLAGKARLRYITDVPGQAETYQTKAAQAREWAATGYAGDAPPFVRAEADRKGIDPVLLAQQIVQLADQWANVKGPEIEAARLYWKGVIEQAQSKEEINAATADAETEIDTL